MKNTWICSNMMTESKAGKVSNGVIANIMEENTIVQMLEQMEDTMPNYTVELSLISGNEKEIVTDVSSANHIHIKIEIDLTEDVEGQTLQFVEYIYIKLNHTSLTEGQDYIPMNYNV
jgi:hypothetical protein